jgi:hypothetical protein
VAPPVSHPDDISNTSEQQVVLRPSLSAPGKPDVAHVRTRAMGQVVILEVAGQLSDVVEDLDQAIQRALAEGPRGVVCDLSTVEDGTPPGAVEVLASAGRHVRDWAAIPLAVACPDRRVRRMLGAQPLGRHLILTDSMPSAVSAVLATPVPTVEWLRLAPHPTAPHAARNFVTRTLLGWGLDPLVPCCCLVVSELVTNSTIHAGTDIELSVAWSAGSLRLTVRDNSPDLPRQRYTRFDVHGRGLSIVAGLSRTFGVLGTADGGKVVWAVMYAARPRPHRREPATTNLEPHELGHTNIPITQGNS